MIDEGKKEIFKLSSCQSNIYLGFAMFSIFFRIYLGAEIFNG